MPAILREAGLEVRAYAEVFESDRVSDSAWLQKVARSGWIGLSHDDNIRRDPAAVRAVLESGGRLFILRGAMPTRELARLFLDALDSVARMLLRHPEGVIANIRRENRRGGKVHVAVEAMITGNGWRDPP